MREYDEIHCGRYVTGEGEMKFFRSSFLVLSLIAILAGASGALLSGMFDFKPPPEGIFSFGNYLHGARFGATLAALGLVPYWLFHAVVGDILVSWDALEYKVWRVIWVVCWAMFLAFFLSRGLAV